MSTDRRLVLRYSNRDGTKLFLNEMDISTSVLYDGFRLEYSDGIPRVTLELVADEVLLELEDTKYIIKREN